MNSIVLAYCNLEITYVPLFSSHYDSIKTAYIIKDGIATPVTDYKLVTIPHPLTFEYGFFILKRLAIYDKT
jgi:hypothetical protein